MNMIDISSYESLSAMSRVRNVNVTLSVILIITYA